MLFTPLPMMVFDLATEDILWSSESFLQLTEQREGIFDAHLETVFPNISFHWLLEGKTEAPETVVWNHRTYRVFGGVSHPEGGRSALATTSRTASSTSKRLAAKSEKLFSSNTKR